jgi:hypothetical protein
VWLFAWAARLATIIVDHVERSASWYPRQGQCLQSDLCWWADISGDSKADFVTIKNAP